MQFPLQQHHKNRAWRCRRAQIELFARRTRRRLVVIRRCRFVIEWGARVGWCFRRNTRRFAQIDTRCARARIQNMDRIPSWQMSPRAAMANTKQRSRLEFHKVALAGDKRISHEHPNFVRAICRCRGRNSFREICARTCSPNFNILRGSVAHVIYQEILVYQEFFSICLACADSWLPPPAARKYWHIFICCFAFALRLFDTFAAWFSK